MPNNKSENKRFEDATKAAGLTDDQKQQMYQDLQKDPDKDGKTFKELKEIAEEYKQQ